jgi:hypothetical protein
MNSYLENETESYQFQSLVETPEHDNDPWVDWSIREWLDYVEQNPDIEFGISFAVNY